MTKIPTAITGLEGILQKADMYGDYDIATKLLVDDKIEFAKFHVKLALQAVTKLDLDDIPNIPNANDMEEAREMYILNAYPDSKII